jgi:outer membrane protein
MNKLLLLMVLINNLTLANDEGAVNSNKTPSYGQGYIYGAGVAYQQQIYKGFDQRTIAIPLLGYVGEKLNVFGPFVSYSLFKKNDWAFDLNLSPRFNGFDDEDSDFFIGMQERKDSLDAGFALKYNPNNWSYQFKALTDVLSKSNGTDIELNFTRKFKYKFLTIEPSLSIQHLDKNLTDYYYGVQQLEVTSNRSYFEGSSTINKSLNLSLTTPSPIGLVRLDLGNTWFGSGITDSPLVEKDHSFGMRLFFITFFK